jgi:hypothetical protein
VAEMAAAHERGCPKNRQSPARGGKRPTHRCTWLRTFTAGGGGCGAGERRGQVLAAASESCGSSSSWGQQRDLPEDRAVVAAAAVRLALDRTRIAGLGPVQVGSSAVARLPDSQWLKSAVLQPRWATSSR